jgi:hypothetical protein
MLDIKEEVLKFLNTLGFEIKANQIRQGKNVTGKTALSIEAEADDKGGALYGNISALALETGRKSGKVPYGFKSIILKWINDKGIFQGETDSKKNSIAFLIARKIQREGTQIHRQGGKSGVISEVVTEKRIKDFETSVLSKYGREVQEIVIGSFAQ